MSPDPASTGDQRAPHGERPAAELARIAVARGAGIVERVAGGVRRRLLAAGTGDGGLKYASHWIPPDQRLARVAIYNSDDEQIFEEGGRRDAERVSKFLSADSVVLDFGCGTGRVARYVAPQCAALWAVDVSPRMLELTRERLREVTNLRFARCHDVAIPKVASASVDVVYSFLVLQHLEREDAFLALRELRRVLRSEGAAIFTFPNLLSDGYLAGFVTYALTGEVNNQARARIYTPQEVERLLPAAGFSVVDIEAGDDIVATCRPSAG